MNEQHETNRRLWDARSTAWTQRPEVAGLWQRCALKPGGQHMVSEAAPKPAYTDVGVRAKAEFMSE